MEIGGITGIIDDQNGMAIKSSNADVTLLPIIIRNFTIYMTNDNKS